MHTTAPHPRHRPVRDRLGPTRPFDRRPPRCSRWLLGSTLLGLSGCPSDSEGTTTVTTSADPTTSTSSPTGVTSMTAPTTETTAPTEDSAEGPGSTTATGSTSMSADSTGPGARTMGFFVTSTGNGPDGGNYGGLSGADARCQQLADAAGAGARTWQAYLSQAALDGAEVVHARDRIGAGPWTNAAGELVAGDVERLHAGGIDPALMLDENGMPAGKGRPPGPEHDIITGTDEDGMLFGPGRTCNNWTSSDPGDQVRVGHHDWSIIPMPITPDQHWASVHDSPCDAAGMAAILGSGRLYCFAID